MSPLALFLDVDGTLLDIAPAPDRVMVPAELKLLLRTLHERLEGALAMISGRPIAQIDRLFAPLRLPAAGLHGMERRDAAGTYLPPLLDPAALQKTRICLTDFTAAHAGTLLEDKGHTLALHYRQAPQFEAQARAAAAQALELLGSNWHILEGRKVIELQPRAFTKGGAIEQLMRTPPFAGRKPVFIGDDRTDETGFLYVNGCGGQTIYVGARQETFAQQRLPDVAAVHRWLNSLADAGGEAAAGSNRQ